MTTKTNESLKLWWEELMNITFIIQITKYISKLDETHSTYVLPRTFLAITKSGKL